jgi:hypothetical protein
VQGRKLTSGSQKYGIKDLFSGMLWIPGGLPAKPPLLQRNQTPYRGRSRTGVGARLRLFLWL